MRNILITGGTGTLGHALVKRLYGEYGITIYSRSESSQAQMRRLYPECRYVLGDIRDYQTLQAAIAGHDTVIHAAAVKRIPEAEAQPGNCHEINVVGSEFVARACQVHGVERCVGISTDKACQPVTVYGATKLLMEKIFQAQADDTVFTLARFGNVMQSTGSVIPLWRQQAAEGRPLTITDMEMTRFWMTPDQAAKEVIATQALCTGEILVPKMKALSICQMARWIAPEARITGIGMRSTERVHEWLVSPDEVVHETENYFIVNPTGSLRDGAPGCAYRSDTAPQLTQDEFLSMLAEVEA
jgi:UDP-N-acetylglucosamine 4,6-dehydratase